MTTTPTLPIGLVWHRSIGSGHFAFGTTSDGRAVKVTTVCQGTLVLVETVDGQMMPTGTIGHFDSAEAAVDAFGIHVPTTDVADGRGGWVGSTQHGPVTR